MEILAEPCQPHMAMMLGSRALYSHPEFPGTLLPLTPNLHRLAPSGPCILLQCSQLEWPVPSPVIEEKQEDGCGAYYLKESPVADAIGQSC